VATGRGPFRLRDQRRRCPHPGARSRRKSDAKKDGAHRRGCAGSFAKKRLSEGLVRAGFGKSIARIENRVLVVRNPDRPGSRQIRGARSAWRTRRTSLISNVCSGPRLRSFWREAWRVCRGLLAVGLTAGPWAVASSTGLWAFGPHLRWSRAALPGATARQGDGGSAAHVGLLRGRPKTTALEASGPVTTVGR